MALNKSKKRLGPISRPIKIDLKDDQATERFVETTIDPVTGFHHVMCDICGSPIKLTTRGDPSNLHKHRTACKRDFGPKLRPVLPRLSIASIPDGRPTTSVRLLRHACTMESNSTASF
jgi:hypothetical protein